MESHIKRATYKKYNSELTAALFYILFREKWRPRAEKDVDLSISTLAASILGIVRIAMSLS